MGEVVKLMPRKRRRRVPLGALVGIAMIVFGAAFLYVSHESPWFPDKDLVRDGLFTGHGKSVDVLVLAMCNDSDGDPTIEPNPCSVWCELPNNKRWRIALPESFCDDLGVIPTRSKP